MYDMQMISEGGKNITDPYSDSFNISISIDLAEFVRALTDAYNVSPFAFCGIIFFFLLCFICILYFIHFTCRSVNNSKHEKRKFERRKKREKK